MAATLHTARIGLVITFADGTSGRITGRDDDQDTWRVTRYHGTDSPMVGRPMNHDHLTSDKIAELISPRIPTGQKCSYWLPNGSSRICVRVEGPGDPMEPGWQPCKILTMGRTDYRYGTIITLDVAHLIPRHW